MTEQEWLASEDPAAMLSLCIGNDANVAEGLPGRLILSDRKLRLFACVICRQVWHLPTDRRGRDAVEVAERYADGLATCKERGMAYNAADNIKDSVQRLTAQACLRSDAAAGVRDMLQAYLNGAGQRARQAALMREVAGNPFRPVTPPKGAICEACYNTNERGPASHGNWRKCECPRCGGKGYESPPWLTPQVLTLAQAAYDEQKRRCPRKCNKGRLDSSHPDWPGPHPKLGPLPVACGACKDGVIDDGSLDPFRLALVADALLDAGCLLVVDEEYQEEDWCNGCNGGGKDLRTGRYPEDCDDCFSCAGTGRVALLRKRTTYQTHPIVEHLRSPSPHVRGCWVIDLLLGLA